MTVKQILKTFFIVALVVPIGCASISLAQTGDESYVASDQETQLFVDEITFAKDGLDPGDVITGTFKLHNVGAHVVTDVSYRVELVTLFDEGGFTIPSQAIHTSPMSESFLLRSGAEVVSFTYTLPQQIPTSRLGLLIQTYEGPTPSAYEFAEFEVVGGTIAFLPKRAAVLLNGNEFFELLEGPTVEKTETVQLDTVIMNDTKAKVTLVPAIQIMAGPSIDGAPVHKKTFPAVAIAAGAEYPMKYDLPLATEEPGVYTVLLTHTTTDGATVMPIEARYIIAGLKPQIESVTYNATDLTTQDNVFEVHVKYMDTPINMRKNADGTFKDPRAAAFFTSGADAVPASAQDMTAQVRVTDTTSGEILHESTLPFEDGVIDVIARTESVIAVSNVLVEVALLQKGEVVDTYTENVPLETAPQKNFFRDLWNNHTVAVLAFGLGALLVLIIVLLVIQFRKPRVTTTI